MLAVKRVVAMRSGSSALCEKESLYVNTNFVKSVKKINLILLMIVYTGLFPVSSTFLEANNTEEICVSVHLRRVRVSIPGHSSILWTTGKTLQIWRRDFLVEC